MENNRLCEKPKFESKVSVWTWRVSLAGVTTITGISIPVGFNLGVINAPAEIIRAWSNESVYERHGMILDNELLDSLWSSIVSIFIIGGFVGSLCGSPLADKIGRKGALVLCGILFLISAIIFVLSKPLNLVEMVLLGRLIVGLGSGIVFTVMPMYLTEIAPVNLRGTVGIFCPVGLCSGVCISQVLGWPEFLGTSGSWNYLFGFYALLIVPCILALPFLSESPKYLYSVRKMKQKAIQELSKLRELPYDNVCEELDEKENSEVLSIFEAIKTKELRINLALVCALHFGQQLSGVNAVFFYSTTIFISGGLDDEMAKYASLGAAIVNLITVIVMIPIINKLSRRTMLITSCTLATVFLTLLSIFISNMNSFDFMPYLAIVCVFCFIISLNIGLGPIPFFIGSELFDLGPRGSAMALGSVANWTGNFLVSMTFLAVQRMLGANCFLVFASSTALLALFLKFYLPETNPNMSSAKSNVI